MLKLSLYTHTHDWHEKKNTYILVCCTIDSRFWLSKNFLKWRVVLWYTRICIEINYHWRALTYSKRSCNINYTIWHFLLNSFWKGKYCPKSWEFANIIYYCYNVRQLLHCAIQIYMIFISVPTLVLLLLYCIVKQDGKDLGIQFVFSLRIERVSCDKVRSPLSLPYAQWTKKECNK